MQPTDKRCQVVTTCIVKYTQLRDERFRLTNHSEENWTRKNIITNENEPWIHNPRCRPEEKCCSCTKCWIMNNTVNSTSVPDIEGECDMYWLSTISFKVGRTVILSAIMSVALLGNVLVVTVFNKFNSVRTNTNYFIVNMAVSDMLFPIVLWPTEMIDMWTGYNRRWFIGGPLGQLTCKLTAFLIDVSSTVSIQSLVLVAVERFVAVVYPMQMAKFTRTTRTRSIIATWIVAAVIHSPYFYLFRLIQWENKNYCVPDWQPAFDSYTANRIYFPTFCVLLFVAPVIVIALLYAKIALVLKQTTVPGNQPRSQESTRRRKQSKKVLNMSLAIVITFVLCWLPERLYIFLRFSFHYCELMRFNFFALLLAYTSSALNPWVLFIFSEKYRHGLRGILPCCFCSKNPDLSGDNVAVQLDNAHAKHFPTRKVTRDNSENTEQVSFLSSLRLSLKRS